MSQMKTDQHVLKKESLNYHKVSLSIDNRKEAVQVLYTEDRS